MGNRLFSTYNMVLSAIGAAIIVIGSMISLTVMAVPFTMQTFAVFAVLMTIGGRRGTLSIICYLLLGAVGIPVFAGFKGGFGVLLGPTGGFLIGFIGVGILYRILSATMLNDKAAKAGRRMINKAVTAVICEIVMYAFGVVWFMTVYAAQTGPVGLSSALAWCVIPFIIPDIVKIIAAVAVSEACSKAVKD